MPHPRLVARRTGDLRRALGQEIRRLASDAGVSLRAVSRESGVDSGHLTRIVRGDVEASLSTLVAIGEALGADLGVHLYPNAGSPIRDRHQAAITDALLAIVDATRWIGTPEVLVRRPVRGWVDLALHDQGAALLVATEIESLIRRLEQLLRWHQEKVDALPSSKLWPFVTADGPVTTSRLLVIRSTVTNRQIAIEHEPLLRAAFPGPTEVARAALTGSGPWPGPAILWADVRNGHATIRAGPPRGVRLGRQVLRPAQQTRTTTVAGAPFVTHR
jgi:transcriptional regulator with XRE-family HTH domain